MKYRRLGNSGMKISEIGLGSWLTYGETVGNQNAKEIIHKAFDLGINFFDTANAYNRGAAEKVVGEILSEFSRSSYVLATKVYFPMGEGPNDRGLSRKHIIEQCEASLTRLGVDYIDLYQCHRFDEETPTEETLMALDDLVRQGKILYYGVSEWSAAQITDAVHLTKSRNLHPLVSNQPIYNMLVRYIEKEVLPVSEENGIGQVVFSPLAQGILTGKYKPGHEIPSDSRAANEKINGLIQTYLKDEILERVAKLEALAKNELNVKLSQLAIAWVLRQPGVSSAIVGASRPAQVEENAKASDIVLSEALLEEISGILQEIDGFLPKW
ncbi:voltage-dependent potassium channel beta subunit [Pullulanibacillus pueri]|uniref:Aldo/keto reductase n=1 Tax=Pullulanibacillus pueri TaxID=1437324 RepID=A0A8J3EMR7_9BACL|nr:aldo/keto reductase family protein [Pullulanibacillus pueri]MBM7682405.1 voltage-dependent potassium channel beta subunit [Pullulanibacillus pueri]GGH81765.1 aldo/keto reductase [Pullulanibacillus pueri]